MGEERAVVPRGRGAGREAAAAVPAGAVIGAIEVVLMVSFAALIFSGGLSSHRPAGVSVLLLSAVVITAVPAVLGRRTATVWCREHGN